MTMRNTVLIVTSMLACGSAQAAEKFLDGAYGNEIGCIFSRTGEYASAGMFELLNDEGILTDNTTCEFRGRATKKPFGFSHPIRCRSEEEIGAVETVDLLRSPQGYTVRFKDGIEWGPMPKCH